MRIKILGYVALIFLGIVVFSVISSFNSGSISDDKSLIQKIEINNSFPKILEDWNGFKTVTADTDKIRKASVNENSTKNLSEAGENSIFEEIKLDNSSIAAPETCDHFETIIVNSLKFRELASNGTLNLSLMGEDYELKLQETDTLNPDTTYSGYIVGEPQSSAFFTVSNDSVNGCINMDFDTLSYGITATDKKYDGNTVHSVCRYYNEGMEKELKKRYSLDPLEFSLRNSDNKSHEIYMELFDFYNKSIFKETYKMNSGDEIFSPKIDAERGYYRYEIILDNKLTFEHKVRADYASELGSSEKLHLNILGDPDNPIEFGSVIA
jgi:hypothetical protein